MNLGTALASGDTPNYMCAVSEMDQVELEEQ